MVGCGHMGSALLSFWHKQKSNKITIIDPKKYKILNKKFKRKISAFNSVEKIKDYKIFNIIIFCVTPQVSASVLEKFRNFEYKKNVLFVSIIAGKKISFFNNYLPKNNQFIRVMPNMPASIGYGLSCLVANKKTSIINRNKAINLFSKSGKAIMFKSEKDIDKVTAISGSGPGYFFLFINLLQQSAINLGFSKKISRDLVLYTALGSIKLILKDKDAEFYLKKIAIKGGTTEAAIKEFNRSNIFKKIINKAIKTAYFRSIKLGKS
tara:strand:+ start:672 stop:1466 length:795 start_codon:yes stop_codon:yes gene_type:complete